MKSLHTPLLDRLKEHYAKQDYSFHVPGHKYGELWKDDSIKQNLLSLDVTELRGLDDLHDPSGIIKEAQRKAAEVYKADYSYFLINGTTVGNLAMILATCKKGSKVLVQRNAHKSLMNGIKLAQAHPIFLTPEIDEETGVSVGVSLEQIQSAFEAYGPFDAVLLTNPNYYGMTQDLTEIIDYIHTKKCPVLVDEAHGAHFGIGSPFPPSSLSMGADVVVQSAHKTLPAMTMASYMHMKSSMINRSTLEEKLQLLQSSSPSYVLMASLDFARAYLEAIEPSDIPEITKSIQAFIEQLSAIPQIKVIRNQGRYEWLDPLKLTIQSRTDLSGYALQKLFESVGIYTELADPYNVLFILPLRPMQSTDEIVSRMKSLLKSFKVRENDLVKLNGMNFPSVTQLELNEEEINEQKTVKMKLSDAKDYISAETIIPYPPGIPVILKGERITKEHIDYCQFLVEYEARFQGNQLNEGISVIIERRNLEEISYE
ncbi:aminotransferase class I/II-fold pyridoxal phosphate-dependent enzyme [Pseudalkalibacillus berkeleyi]|uniref:Aminotransferase class I/II-fold pyridoxal phosphate-dependent enzyme n=1 Tax=Pseudalkalibacillus berkeleyi TaxID=1069813 RepID=A0ABS9H6L9_9BACL|nr:aminotransferase class I/II-fold pyridoxal phosphate-dependent enzyme [Pseudalkalibacillus berkeleyi]MCF6139566.1 aminotransferase class I/II-fold pyridoxal phosphate-dependent enzyme [Pseudalkalibacillus berkeleyi]